MYNTVEPHSNESKWIQIKFANAKTSLMLNLEWGAIITLDTFHQLYHFLTVPPFMAYISGKHIFFPTHINNIDYTNT